jgi:hypothetical protein
VPTLFDHLASVRKNVAIAAPIKALLSGLTIVGAPPAEGENGLVQLGADTVVFGLFHLTGAPGGPNIPFRWRGADGGFRADLLLSKIPALSQLLRFADLNSVLRQATINTAPAADGATPTTWLTKKNNDPVDLKAALALSIVGTPAIPAEIHWLSLDTGDDPHDGIIAIQPDPGQILFGDSGFGVDLSGGDGTGIFLDDSITQAPPAAAGSAPSVPGWTGVAIRGCRLFVPRNVPLIGGTAIPFDLDFGTPGGAEGVSTVTIPAAGPRPEIVVRLEWHNPSATSLIDLIPTLIEATATIPVSDRQVSTPSDGPVVLAGGAPLTIRVRCARRLDAAPGVEFSVSVDALGPDGLIKVSGASTAGKIFVTAAALATAVVADARLDHRPASGDASGVWLHGLLLAAAGGSVFFDPTGQVVVEGIVLSGDTSSGTVIRLHVDYLVDAKVTTFGLDGVLSIGMNDKRPLRIRYRNVVVEGNLSAGIDDVYLTFDESTLEVVDPGLWTVTSPGSLLDVIGTRSGRGSQWFEVDLQFKLDLGPITVSNATVRLSLPGPTLEFRGLAVQINAGPLQGRGLAKISGTGFSADLSASIGKPLGIGARVMFAYAGESTIAMGVIAALPGAIPVGPTGLGIYSLGGMFGLNARPDLPAGGDIVQRQLDWQESQIKPDPGAMMFGLQVGLGTLYDMAFSFSATGKLILTIPDLSVRIAVNASVLRVPDFVNPHDAILKGVVFFDDDAIAIGVRGDFVIDELLKVHIPLDGRIPFADPTGWYLRLGSDGAPDRPPGPMTAVVLPSLFKLGGFAYLMIQGDTIDRFGNNGEQPNKLPGPAIGFGMGVDLKWGAPPVAWMQLSARAKAGLATDPWFLAGSGTISGAVHLGPFSIGARAVLGVQVGPGARFAAKSTVCVSIDLWLTEIEGCVGIAIPPTALAPLVVPDPGEWPLHAVTLSDRHYTELAQAATNPADAPTVWPDVVPIVQFSPGPDATNITTNAFHITAMNNAGAGISGNDYLKYQYSLQTLQIFAVDEHGTQTPVPGGIEAAWLQPKHLDGAGAAGGSPAGARELALLTHRADMWAHRLTDGGLGSSGDPVTATQNGCHIPHNAALGWAIGGAAVADSLGWTLPSDSLPAMHPSVFTATATSEPWDGVVLTDAAVLARVRAPLSFLPAGVVDVGECVVADKSFTAALGLPAVVSAQEPIHTLRILGSDFRMAVNLAANDKLINAELWLLIDPQYEQLAGEIDVTDIVTPGQNAAQWSRITPDGIPVDGGQIAIGFAAQSDTWGARVGYSPVLALKVLGIRAITSTAQDGAVRAGQNAATSAATINNHNNTAPQFRTPIRLAPKTLYKIAIGLTAEGTMPGTAPVTFPPTGEQHFEYWFRTADLSVTDAPETDYHPPNPMLQWTEISWHQKVFKTGYLSRYLSSYSPGDRTINWYPDDPLVANFDVDHVDQLAQLYGYRLDLVCARTDTPPSEGQLIDPQVLFPHLTWLELVDPLALTELDRRYLEIDLEASCPLPKSGASLGGVAPLATRATYQLAVAVTPVGPAPPAQNLPGIIFTTSRYRGPGDQFAHLGFGSPAGSPQGNLIAASASLPPMAGSSDGSFDAALSALGQPGWPLTRDGRTSVVWVRDGAGLACIGVLLESPEPLVRPGRLSLDRLAINGAVAPLHFSDSAGCRHLFAVAAPIPMATGTAVDLVVSYTDGSTAVTAQCGAHCPDPRAVLR